MHVTILIKHLHYEYYIDTKATNLAEQQFRSDLGACIINYRLHGMKLKNHMFVCVLIS